jgi:hypothetical protein
VMRSLAVTSMHLAPPRTPRRVHFPLSPSQRPPFHARNLGGIKQPRVAGHLGTVFANRGGNGLRRFQGWAREVLCLTRLRASDIRRQRC